MKMVQTQVCENKTLQFSKLPVTLFTRMALPNNKFYYDVVWCGMYQNCNSLHIHPTIIIMQWGKHDHARPCMTMYVHV